MQHSNTTLHVLLTGETGWPLLQLSFLVLVSCWGNPVGPSTTAVTTVACH